MNRRLMMCATAITSPHEKVTDRRRLTTGAIIAERWNVGRVVDTGRASAALLGDRVISEAQLLSDGVSNAYLVDVWTQSNFRRQGVGRAMVEQLCRAAPGQHVGLQTDQLATSLRRRQRGESGQGARGPDR
jgi:ribosomal protein S18 acetylase RimI-like enzyme